MVARAYLADLHGYVAQCDGIVAEVDRCLGDVGTVEHSYQSVAERSRSLQEACERLLEQQTHMASLAESLADRLAYFNELEPIARLFNTPGDAVVLHARFLPSLTRLDQCLAYMDANVHPLSLSLATLRTRLPLTPLPHASPPSVMPTCIG